MQIKKQKLINLNENVVRTWLIMDFNPSISIFRNPVPLSSSTAVFKLYFTEFWCPGGFVSGPKILRRVLNGRIPWWFPALNQCSSALTHWKIQFQGRLIRSPRSPKRRKGYGALKEKIGVWHSQRGGKEKCFSFFYIPWS